MRRCETAERAGTPGPLLFCAPGMGVSLGVRVPWKTIVKIDMPGQAAHGLTLRASSSKLSLDEVGTSRSCVST
jgi:hypothetical protein